MAPRNATPENGHRFHAARGPFPRSQRRVRDAQPEGWTPVELGGHEVVARLHLDLRTGPEAGAEGRHALERLRGSIARSQLDTLRLLVTELLTNSIRHSGAGDARIELDVEIYSNAVHVEVIDRGPGFQPKRSPEPHTNRSGGWGLCLVDRLADRWGVAVEGRTRVWFEIDRDDRDDLAGAA
jgi:anti-sigma regulatory factor (Ser/Thr protein kinase)